MKVKNKRIKINKMAVLTVIVCLLAVITIIGIEKAYYNDNKKIENKFKTGEIEITITEPEYDKKLEEEGKIILTPGKTIVKDPTITNSGSIKAYIRAQVYVPIYNIKTVNEDEEIVENSSGVELFSYEVNNSSNNGLINGWVEVTDEGYSGIYEDSEGNTYKVYTYKYLENGEEKIIEAGETINEPVFSSVTVVNYLDQDKEINTTIHIGALGVQTEGGTAEAMWTYYKNQNGTVILGTN